MPKAKITHDGEELEVEIPDEQVAEWGFVPKKQVQDEYVPKANVQATIQARLKEEPAKVRAALKEDTEFIRELAEERGWPVDEEGKLVMPEGGLTADEVQKQVTEKREAWQHQWEEKHLKPKDEKIAAYASENETLRKQMLYGEIIQAAKDAGVIDEKFETLPGAPREAAPVIQQVMHRFKWAPDANQWALISTVGPDGQPQFEINPDENPQRPYADAKVFFEKLREDKTLGPRWFKDTRPGTYGPGNTNGAQIGNKARSKMNETEKLSYIKAHGHEAYLSLPA